MKGVVRQHGVLVFWFLGWFGISVAGFGCYQAGLGSLRAVLMQVWRGFLLLTHTKKPHAFA
jgi:hypothetical protein